MNKKIKSRFAEGVLSIPTQAYQLWVGNFARSVKTTVKVSEAKLLDLTTSADLDGLNQVRNHLIHVYQKSFQKGREYADDDRKICNMVISKMKVDVLISNLYIKTKIQRIKNINSNIPNVTVMLVANHEECIDASSMSEVKTGEIQ